MPAQHQTARSKGLEPRGDPSSTTAWIGRYTPSQMERGRKGGGKNQKRKKGKKARGRFGVRGRGRKKRVKRSEIAMKKF